MFSTLERYHEYIGGYHDSFGEDIMITSGAFSTLQEYHEYIRDVQYIGVFNVDQRILSICSPT